MPSRTRTPLAGCIKWLPPKDELAVSDTILDDGCYNHPVLLLTSHLPNGKADVFIITSFGGVDLETRFPTQLEVRRHHLPIAPSPAHPDNGILLVLRDKSYKLRKNSYVNTRDKRVVRVDLLRPYNRRQPDPCLSKKSFKQLCQYANYEEPLITTPFDRDVPTESTPDILAINRATFRLLEAAQRGSPHEIESSVEQYLLYAESGRRPQSIHAQAPRDHHIRTDPSAAASRSERQPLLSAAGGRENRTPRRYYDTLPTTHPIRPIYGSTGDEEKPFDWENFWKCMKTLAWICAAIAGFYGSYRVGCWVVDVVGRSIIWTKGAFEQTAGRIKGFWSSSMLNRGR
ncbi:hypothetical protein F4860DRAFT_508042 [Xylaria cubensis]|nr:hypothetical protein F4860DRAFT_508042 [Xylaria cubensis]